MTISVNRLLTAALTVFAFTHVAQATNFHVAPSGSDANTGTQAAPFRTIQRAADLAQPGDIINVHEGVYRERVNPRRGGISDSKRIVYQTAPGERVVIKGSEVVNTWVKIRENVWKATIPNAFFGKFNPYRDLIHGDWFSPMGRKHHTGAVYLNGDWLTEAGSLDDVMKQMGADALWFGQMGAENTTIWAQFRSIDPNKQSVEINVRQTVFYPEKTGVNYITVRGFTLEDAATPWAPPTAEQIGLIGAHWSKGWIIEDNVVRFSICSGISLGKYGDQWDNTSADTAEGYVKTVERALADGWSKDRIGHHIVRNNTISECGQAGIVGSLGAAYSTVTHNIIHDIHVRRSFGGAEMAGIKFHGAIDVQISNNHIYRTCLGLWLDWMAQGTRVSRNLFHDNDRDVFVEVDHGPFLFDSNLLLSSASLQTISQGGAYVHNLFAGAIKVLAFDTRQTPFLKEHSTVIAGFHDNPRGDDRYYNNLFVGPAHLIQYDNVELPVWMGGNVFLKGARPSKHEASPLIEPDFDPGKQLVEKADGLYLKFGFDKTWTNERTRKLVTTALLGRTAISHLPYEQPDGSPIRIDTDYLGDPRSKSHPTSGPFEHLNSLDFTVKVW